ncbi:MAG TPA: hypothetical protein VE173_00120 [Longimicrobiales bacterium]|nr:hypothetical protein [Longimicrobiales bacterium]
MEQTRKLEVHGPGSTLVVNTLSREAIVTKTGRIDVPVGPSDVVG